MLGGGEGRVGARGQVFGGLDKAGRVELVAEFGDEARESLGGDLGVELEGEDAVCEHEALVRAGGAGGEAQGSGGQLEGVPVPVHDFEGGGQEWEAGARFRGEFDGKDADLDMRILDDAGAEGVGEELGAEADPDRGFPGGDVGGDERPLGAQPGMVAVLVDVHRAAHDDEEVHGFGGGEGLAAVEVGRGHGGAARARPVGDGAWAFAADVLENVEVHGFGNLELRKYGCG